MTIPPIPENWGGSDNGRLPITSRWARLGSLEPIEPLYVERPLLQAATFHLFAGRLGVGKGAIIAGWVARCTNGAMYGRPRNALLLASEEDPQRDLFPRLTVAGGDTNRLTLIPNDFLLPRDIEVLRDATREIGDVGLICLDPLSNHIGGTNSNADEEVRNALQPLAILAGDLDVPMIGVRHVSSKEVSGGFISRILGSSAWPAVARVVIGVAQDEDGRLHVRALKGNRVRYQEAGVRYRLESAQFLNWGETVVLAVAEGESLVDIDALLAQRRDSSSEKARQEIVRLLREEGQLASEIVDGRVAEATGAAVRTVRNMRMELRDRGWIKHIPVNSHDGTIGHWEVALTSFAPPDPLIPKTQDSGDSGDSGYSYETPTTTNPSSPTSFKSARARTPESGVSGDSGVSGEDSRDSRDSGEPGDMSVFPIQSEEQTAFPIDDGGTP